MHAVKITIVATLAVVALAGCSAGDEAELDWQDSPLNAYLSGQGEQTEDEMQAQFEQRQAKVEELVAQCMSEEGFEYLPVDYSQPAVSSSSDDDVWDTEDPEWVAQYGYGAVDFPGRDEPQTEENTFVDPNADYIATLSESELNAYNEVLYGEPPTEEEIGDDGSYEYDWEQAGCQGWAQHEIEGDDVWSSDRHKPLTDAISAFYEGMSTDPAMSELEAAWSSCMADAGHPGFTAQPDAAQSIYDQLNEYYETRTEFVDDDPELQKIADEEIPLAVADLECREQTDYRQEQLRVQFELEERFIAEHKAELEAFKADIEQQQVG